MMNNTETQRANVPGIQETALNIATATGRNESRWKNRTVTLGDFVRKLSEPTRTPETVEDFHSKPKTAQDEIKDVGGYVGGVLKGGKRSKTTVANRQIVTLDMDHGKEHLEKLLGQIKGALGATAYVVHCTHKHRPERPRLRVVSFLDRPVYPDEFQAIARKLAADIGIELFDKTTFEPHRLMYWPSIPTDAEWVWVDNTGQGAALVCADEILASYGPDDAWTDATLWPTSSQEKSVIERQIKQQADPLTKKGIVGAFCRAFDVHKAIKEFLPEVYGHEGGDRYTFIDGSSSKGVVIYEGGKFAYSNHATDPASNTLCNSFDLVRIHKFAHLDDEAKDGTPVVKLPSFGAMQEWASELPAVKIEVVKSISDQFEAVEGQFCANENGQEDPDAWMEKLHITKTGALKSTYYNATIIFENDPQWKGLLWRNDHTTFKEKGRGGDEWTDQDTLSARKDLAERYKIDITSVIATDALDHVASLQSYHPVREYLKSLKWDGVKRAERLWIDYLGEEDNAYTRETALKWLLAAVYRAFVPGYKFDYVPVIEGQQGIMKTTMCRILAKKPEWFGELNTVDNQKAVEQMKGKWIMEMGELELNNRHELEQVKAFISGTETMVRLSYKREPGIFKRQCVFVGTTNQKEYLKDSTGNRRWWPLKAADRYREGGDALDMKRLAAEVDQIWAEVVEYFYDPDSTTELTKQAIKLAMQRQKEKMHTDEWIGIIEAWLEMPASVDRYALDSNIGFPPVDSGNNTEKRDRVCAIEIWEDCLRMKGKPKRVDSNRIARIMDSFPNWKRASCTRFGDRFGFQKGWLPTS